MLLCFCLIFCCTLYYSPIWHYICCWHNFLSCLHPAEEQQSRGKCLPVWILIMFREACITSASLPPKMRPFLLFTPQRHSGTQSRAEEGNGVTSSSEVFVEKSSWFISFQAFVVVLKNAILEGELLFESLPPRAKIRSPPRKRACWLLPRDWSTFRTVTTLPELTS